MNIAFVSSGNSIHVKKLANGLIENGHNVTLYTLPNHTNLISDFDSKIKIVRLRFKGKLGYYLNTFQLRKYIVRGNYDIVNCHYVSGYGTLVRLAGIKGVVASVFGSDVYTFPYKSKRNMKIVIKNLDHAEIITSTSYVMADKVKEFYTKDRNIKVTHFGVDLKLFNLSLNNKKNDNDVFTFGAVKKMVDTYGIDVLINAFSLFIKSEKYSDKKIQLVLYGSGVHLDKYKKMVSKLNLEKKIIFKGYIPNKEVPKALETIDVVCLPSINESFGVAAVEAMACAKPLIVSDAPGFLEVIEPDITGYVVKKGDPNDLAYMMEKLYNMNPEERIKLGIRGRKRVEDLFDFNDNIKNYLNAITKNSC